MKRVIFELETMALPRGLIGVVGLAAVSPGAPQASASTRGDASVHIISVFEGVLGLVSPNAPFGGRLGVEFLVEKVAFLVVF